MEPKPILTCRMCGEQTFTPILDLGTMAMTGVFPRARDEAVASGPLELIRCEDCRLVQLRHTCDLPSLFGEGYGYRSGLNSAMVGHLGGITAWIEEFVGLAEGDAVLDIGSNDGTTLGSYKTKGVALFGIDPTADPFRRYYPEGASVVADFFNGQSAKVALGERKVKAVTSIAMFYDLPDPLQFTKDVSGVLANDGVWVLEQSYLPTMLERLAYDTICHEHLEYYGLRQIKWLADRAGLKIADVSLNDANGGSFRVALVHEEFSIAVDNESKIQKMLEDEDAKTSLEALADFARRTEDHKVRLVAFLEEAKRKGIRTAGYGASTKGNVVLQYCGIDQRLLPEIAEVNADKFGSYTPGTRIPIRSEEAVKASGVDQFLVLPWHFRDFILEKEKEFRSNGGAFVFPFPEIETVGS